MGHAVEFFFVFYCRLETKRIYDYVIAYSIINSVDSVQTTYKPTTHKHTFP